MAVIGHSRGGKTALWVGARDTRFAAAISNDSGSTGAKHARRADEGGGAQTVAGSNNAYPHWYPPTYEASNNRVRELPVDQHELLALITPRRVVVASATQDAHADRRASSWPTWPPRRCTSSTGSAPPVCPRRPGHHDQLRIDDHERAQGFGHKRPFH